ncbi:MAG: aldehyde dehydrogenase family protein, partial [Alphaproteobacteria bacterium]|nr:aldehyde dehydrogenase family protein [Alphaproteobacteria bacterium]
PLIAAFAAGNRAMVKMSENSEHLAQALIEITPRYFAQDKLAFFSDGGGRGPSFTRLPFDHLFFTGSPATGRAVMANAAPNLTPVTLELGGKSPAVVAPDYPMKAAANRIMWAKMLNAGQICTNVDYLFLPEGKIDAFIAEATQIVTKRYPDLTNGDFTAIIDQRSYERLQATRMDAQAKGARLVNLAGGQQGDPARRIMPPEAVVGANDDMMVMQREIFGPLLPILTYRDHREVIDYIGARPRPLALYLYSNDRALQRRYLDNTISGGVGINESVIQAGLHSLPFGGSGNSGMGQYHGKEGFLTFSKLRPVFRQGPIRALDLMMPPYAGLPTRMSNFLLRWKS